MRSSDKNALALVSVKTRRYITRTPLPALLDKAVETVKQRETLKSLSTNIAKLAFTDSANVIAGGIPNQLINTEKKMDVNTLKSVYFIMPENIGMKRIGTLLPVKRPEGKGGDMTVRFSEPQQES